MTNTPQNQLLTTLESLSRINDTLSQDDAITKDLNYLTEKVHNFKVIVPIIGKFSSGKSTLLNRYLGENYLKTDIAPETAIATELCYAEEERLLIHYLDGSTSKAQALSSLDSLVIEENMAFIQVFLNNAILKSHENIILVDMPGFDARNQAHHQAIARYLERGDYFISLMPIDIPFDHSIIERLTEIYFDYGKEVSCLLSKAARKSVTQREENKQQLAKTLQDSLQTEVEVGYIETQAANDLNMSDFERQLDKAGNNFDALLLDRYNPLVLEKLEHIENIIQRMRHLSEAGDIELKEQIIAAQAEFKRIEASLRSDIASFENKLCHIGKETLIGQAQSALNAALPQLVTAAKSNSLNNAIAEILRPILQGQLSQLIHAELETLELKIGQILTSDELNLNLSIQLPPAEKELLLNDTISIVSTVVALFFPQHRIGKLILAAMSLFFGNRQREEENPDALIEEQVRNEVIPQALNQVILHVDTEITKVAGHIKQQFMQSFASERNSYEKLINDLLLEQENKQKDYEEKHGLYTQVLKELTELKTTLS